MRPLTSREGLLFVCVRDFASKSSHQWRRELSRTRIIVIAIGLNYCGRNAAWGGGCFGGKGRGGGAGGGGWEGGVGGGGVGKKKLNHFFSGGGGGGRPTHAEPATAFAGTLSSPHPTHWNSFPVSAPALVALWQRSWADGRMVYPLKIFRSFHLTFMWTAAQLDPGCLFLFFSILFLGLFFFFSHGDRPPRIGQPLSRGRQTFTAARDFSLYQYTNQALRFLFDVRNRDPTRDRGQLHRRLPNWNGRTR